MSVIDELTELLAAWIEDIDSVPIRPACGGVPTQDMGLEAP